MVKHLLVGFDGSEESWHALKWAHELAQQTAAKLDVVAVVRPPEVGADVETEAIIHNARKHFRNLVSEAVAELHPEAEAIVLVGHPAERLLRYAEEHDIDHIVVGHRSRGAIERWWAGSISRQVSDYATCSVTIVR